MKKYLLLLFTLVSLCVYGQQSSCCASKNKAKCSLHIEMISVKGGTFWRGCTTEQRQNNECDEDEVGRHQVTLKSFSIGKYPVTKAQWQAVMGKNPSRFKGDNLPVENVTWYDVQMFIARLNALTGKQYRLPTEAEWEFAARGGNKSRGYKYAGSNNVTEVGWVKENSDNRTHPVGSLKPNELGIYDMNGNVREWTADWHAPYTEGAKKNPEGAAVGAERVIKGGFYGSGPVGSRSVNRNSNAPDKSLHNGFRLALSQ
jgi:formylglycine-generating enzyme required for sulfatase activity